MNSPSPHTSSAPQQASLFWQKSGTPQDSADCPRCEVDPACSQQRLTAQVVAVVDETPSMKTFVIRPARRWNGFLPGQYLSVEVDIDGVRRHRNYSIASSPEEFGDTGLIAITVKKQENGHLSTHLHTHLLPGDYLSISEAMGSIPCEQLCSQELTNRDRNDVQQPHNPLVTTAVSGTTPIQSTLEDCAILQPGYQVEPHSFPDIPALRHPEMSIKVRQIRGKYDIPYTTDRFGRQYLTVLARVAPCSLPPANHPLRRWVQRFSRTSRHLTQGERHDDSVATH